MRKALFLILLASSTLTIAAPRIGHHGEMVLTCHAPMFFNEKPAKDTQVASFQDFQFTASENTDIETLKVAVNNQPIKVTTKKQLSGRYLVTGKLKEPLVKDKAWIRVSSESDDGCNKLHVWNVYIK